jgi:hypothetical protein
MFTSLKRKYKKWRARRLFFRIYFGYMNRYTPGLEKPLLQATDDFYKINEVLRLTEK